MLISVALCTFNGGRFLRAQLDSILNQTVAVGELVICDDCSTDSTFSIIHEYIARYPTIISLHKNDTNRGAVKNFEQCIQRCKGDITFLADQDDIWYPFKVQVIGDYFRTKPDALLVFTDGDLIDEAGNAMHGTVWGKWNFNKEMRERWTDNDLAFDDLVRNNNRVTGATLAMKNALRQHIFPFRSNVHYWHDAWLAMYAAKYGGLSFIERSLIKYRIHAKQLVGIGNGTSARDTRPAYKRLAGKILRRFKSASA